MSDKNQSASNPQQRRKMAAKSAARLKVAILKHQKLLAAISIFVITLLFHLSRQSSSPYGYYDSHRYGVGGRDAQGELATALRRKDNGRAAVAIIRVVGMSSHQPTSNLSNNDETKYTKHYHPHHDVQYLVQMKSHDYPIKSFRGSVCLLGGNANKKDTTPLDTLKRELNEELLTPEWVNAIDAEKVANYSHLQVTRPPQPIYNSTLIPLVPGTVRYLGTTLHSQTAQVIQKPNPYAFLCALYEITLRPDQLPPSVLHPRGSNVKEGKLVLLTREQLLQHAKYAWGYEYTMELYFGGKVAHVQKGVSVEEVEEVESSILNWAPEKRKI